MNIYKLHDRAVNNIKTIIDQLRIEEKYLSRAENILRKANNIAVIYENNQLIGLINFKFVLEKDVVYCPVHLLKSYSIKNIDIVLRYLESEYPDNKFRYCELINMFYSDVENLVTEKTKLYDRIFTMKLTHPSIKPIQQKSFNLAFEDIEFCKLLNIHQDAYKDEVPYAGENWVPLLESFLACQSYKTISCRHQGIITGLCLITENDDSIYIYSICVLNAYRNKGIGMLLLNFLFQNSNKSNYSLSVVESNINAFSLYKRVGFEVREITGLVFNTY